jgi:hypothetical protein
MMVSISSALTSAIVGEVSLATPYPTRGAVTGPTAANPTATIPTKSFVDELRLGLGENVGACRPGQGVALARRLEFSRIVMWIRREKAKGRKDFANPLETILWVPWGKVQNNAPVAVACGWS